MKKILALFVCISMLCGVLVGCGGNSGAGPQSDTPSTEIKTEDENAAICETEKEFYALVKEIMGDEEQSGTLYCSGYDNNQAYNLILNQFFSNDEKKDFAEDNEYRSSVLELVYKEQTATQRATLLLKFKNRKGSPEYTVIFKKE